jgi:hypothetical protein
MLLETCPYCSCRFENGKHRYSNGSHIQNIDNLFFVRCPDCGVSYVSQSLKIFGFLTRKNILPIVLAFVFGLLIINLL